jgi:hypothetical protein
MTEKEEKKLRKIVDNYKWKSSHVVDLEKVVEYCNFVADNYESPDLQHIISGVFKYAIISYIKSFTPSKRTPLTMKYIADLPGEPIKVHEYYKKFRDQSIAHFEGIYDTAQLGIEHNEDNGEEQLIVLNLWKHLEDKKYVIQLRDIAQHIMNKLNNELLQEHAKILQIVKTYPDLFMQGEMGCRFNERNEIIDLE